MYRCWIAAAAGSLLVLSCAFTAPAGMAHWPGEGNAIDVVHEIPGTLMGGARYAPARVGQGFSFNGVDGAVNVPDDERLRFTQSLTLSAWVKCTGYPPEGQDWGLILFRGDDRPGLDPYFLGVRHDGTLNFGIGGPGGEMANVQAPLPLGRFVHITASLDHGTGLMRLMFGDKVVGETITQVRPLRDLDSGANAGIGIGNHAHRPESLYNMPFQGIIDELTLSGRTTLTLAELNVGALQPAGTLPATVTLAVPAPPGGAVIKLTATEARVPKEVTVPAGEKLARFRIEAGPDVERISVSASYNGSSISQTRSLAPSEAAP